LAPGVGFRGATVFGTGTVLHSSIAGGCNREAAKSATSSSSPGAGESQRDAEYDMDAGVNVSEVLVDLP